MPTVDHEKFLRGFKYSMLTVLSVGLIFYILWLIFLGSFSEIFPYGTYSLAIGGLLLTVSGCIGPGRYRREFEVVIFQPERGSSFSDEIPVSGFVINMDIEEVDVVINDATVKSVKVEDTFIKTTISREDFIDHTVNKAFFKTDKYTSNETFFSTFDYDESMTDEELDELIELDTPEPSKPLSEAKKNYIESISGHIGSVALGVLAGSVLTMLSGIFFDTVILNLLS